MKRSHKLVLGIILALIFISFVVGFMDIWNTAKIYKEVNYEHSGIALSEQ